MENGGLREMGKLSPENPREMGKLSPENPENPENPRKTGRR